MTMKSNMLSGRYKIIEQIGIGGMSYVYKARDTRKRRDVAIKLLKEELCNDKDLLKRFKDEALASRKINHKNVVGIYDTVDEGSLHYIVMEYLDGPTLSKYIQYRGKLSNEETVRISLEIARGLEAAHKEGIIHRDIKPQNIVVMHDGICKLTDFGIARAISSTTQNISVVGTVHYISPEQASNTTIDYRSDIYSLGCAMYEMITGIVPFEGDSPVNIIVSHLRTSIKRPSIDNEKVYKSLEKVIMKCTRIVPRERYQNVTELIDDLNKVLIDTSGDFIKEDVYDESEGKTVIISDEQMELIKNLSSKYTNSRTNQKTDLSKEQKEFNEKYIKHANNNRILIFVIAILLIVLVFAGIALHNANKRSADIVIATVSETVPIQADSIISKSLVGLDLEVANILLKDYNLVVEVIGERYDDEIENGKIISVDEREEDGQKYIRVELSKGPFILDFSDVEKLNATRFSDMALMLDERELPYSTVESYDTKVEKGYIVGCNKNDSDESGELIFTISKGLSEDIRIMPDLTKKNLQEAESILIENDLVLGQIGKIPDAIIGENYIVGQSINKGKEVQRGTKVDVFISSGVSGEFIDVTKGGRYVGKLNTNYIVRKGISPTIVENNEESLIIYVRLKQITSAGIIYKELIQPDKYKIGTVLSLKFDEIEGESGIKNGDIQIVDCASDEVLAYYSILFGEG